MNKDTKHMGLDANQLRHELKQYWGGQDQNYRSPLGKLEYTPGVRFFFLQGGNAGAYWLRDILATQPKIINAARDYGFVCVLLERKEGAAGGKLTVCDDLSTIDLPSGGTQKTPLGKIHFTIDIDHTDIQPGQWVFYIEGGTMMLPNER